MTRYGHLRAVALLLFAPAAFAADIWKDAPFEAIDNQGFISNAGVVITDKGMAIFDSLAPPHWTDCCSVRFAR